MNKQAIIQQLAANYQVFTQYMTSLSEADFLFAQTDKWTAGQQLDHLVKSVSPLILATKLPRFALRLLFGKANRPSKSYEALIQKYKDKLAAGGVATGRFVPSAIAFSQKEKLIEKLNKTVQTLCKGLENFSEEDFDTYILPHPLLGKLTLREMMYFTMYHVTHHHQSIEKSLDR